ncbi:2-hydroxychromene-2-carboxylate isomerase [compost metagenome]
MSKSVEFYFDVGSPASYLAYTQLPALCAQTDSQLIYRPMLLGGVFKATGNASPNSIAAKGAYMTRDLQRYARRYQVTLNFNPYFPINTLHLMRAITGVQMRQPERFAQLLDAVFQALWVRELDLGNLEVVTELLTEKGFEAHEILALTQDEKVKDQLKQTTEQAVARGVFGAPSLFVANELFFGQDRLEFVREALIGQ